MTTEEWNEVLGVADQLQKMKDFYYYVEENFAPVYDKEKKHPNCFLRYRKSETLRNELDMNGVLNEFLQLK